MKKTQSVSWMVVLAASFLFNDISSANDSVGVDRSGDSSTDHPNIVMIISDDQAWTDYGFMGHPVIQTPNLDRLAAESLTFQRGYVPTSLCCPSLASIITGLYPTQHKITGNDPAIPEGLTSRQGKKDPQYKALLKDFKLRLTSIPTLPRMLADQGYVSFQSGKWWQGSYADGGFTAGMTHGDSERGGRHGDEGLKIGRQGLQPIFDFIAEAGEKPFFVWYAPFLPHTPHNPPRRLLDKYKNADRPERLAKYYAMCEWFDETCGELIEHIDEQGLAEETLIIFVTDNGWIQMTSQKERPEGWNKQFAPGSKQSPSEAGIRTPIMLRWKGTIQPFMDSRTLVSSIDLAPTVLDAANINPSAAMTGVSLLNVTADKSIDRDTIYGEIFAHDIADLNAPSKSLVYRWCIAGDKKLVIHLDGQTGRYGSIHKYMQGDKLPDLFDITKDPNEKVNLYESETTRVVELRSKMDSFFNALPPVK